MAATIARGDMLLQQRLSIMEEIEQFDWLLGKNFRKGDWILKKGRRRFFKGEGK